MNLEPLNESGDEQKGENGGNGNGGNGMEGMEEMKMEKMRMKMEMEEVMEIGKHKWIIGYELWRCSCSGFERGRVPGLLDVHARILKNTKGVLVECLALADLGASINLMPLSIWKKLSLPELTPTQMIFELAEQSTTSPSGIAEDVFVKVGKMSRALIDVYGEELTLRVDDEAITFKVGQTSRYSYNDDVSINQIDVIDVACEEYAQEVLRFLDSSTSGNPTPSLDPILSTSSPSLTPFKEGDFILEEIEACLTNDSIPLGIDDDNFDPEGDLLLLEKLLNDDPLSPLFPKELHVEELKIVKSSIDDPPELELKDLPSHLEYAL
ncbi:reverse transcriptase domain-containing protein [Tanacetum coccineum]